ncbi:hypothetical protein [Ralstonia sp. GX3-BWBA]|uniref:hypothetical protein n=1 Tax=Ralstonia sp. GX3-BWBA TaxID=2219865 RepID=UPI001EF8A2DE|nr:hypothetical protein [Ralstonia sp. GX3-BWBA]
MDAQFSGEASSLTISSLCPHAIGIVDGLLHAIDRRFNVGDPLSQDNLRPNWIEFDTVVSHTKHGDLVAGESTIRAACLILRHIAFEWCQHSSLPNPTHPRIELIPHQKPCSIWRPLFGESAKDHLDVSLLDVSCALQLAPVRVQHVNDSRENLVMHFRCVRIPAAGELLDEHAQVTLEIGSHFLSFKKKYE